VADKVLVLTTLIMLVDVGLCPGWMVAAIVAREFLVSDPGSRRSSARGHDGGA
jgi:phosphatidylglycerophosphate synthase